MRRLMFPEDFIWGVATAAQQVEGAAFEGGRGLSIWDVFCRLPGKVRDGQVPDITCDQYHRYAEDIQLMKKLGVQSYRFSFSWPRIIPDGDGKVNPEGIAYYKALIRELKENGIIPNATMYHWDLPYALQLKGGWGNRESIQWFTRYAKILLDHFGEDIDMWATFNEPIAVYVGYANGTFAPGLTDEKYARQALHHLLVAHGEAVRLFRSYSFPKSKIGIVVDVWHHKPARPGNPEDEAMAEKGNEIAGYGWFLHPLFLRGYSGILDRYYRENGLMPVILEGDFETIRQPLDFYGLNFYNGIIDHADQERQRQARRAQGGGNYQDKPEQHPEAIYEVLHMLREKYKLNIPIYITENGAIQLDFGDRPKEYFLDDGGRIAYLQEVMKSLHRAIEDGIDVRGYYLWSLLDNFEWNVGTFMRYGICYTDFKSLERTPKKSAYWYQKLIAGNALEIE